MLRKWFLILPLIVIALFLFQNLIIFKGIEWSLKKSFQNEFKGELTWASIEHNGSTVVMQGLAVRRDDKITPFQAEKLTLHWDFRLWQRTLYLEAELLNPRVDLVASQVDLLRERTLGLIHVKGALKIEGGQFILPSGETGVDLTLFRGGRSFFTTGGRAP